MKKNVVLSLLLAISAAAVSTPVRGAETAGSTAPVKMNTAHDAMMAKWAAYATPSAGHRVLDAMVGQWNHTVRFWMQPGAPHEESTGTSAIQWILGDRYLRHDVAGTAMGQPFEGTGLIAYDNLAKRYESFWIDSMGTGVMKSTARHDPAARTLIETGTMPDVLAGKTVPYRAVTKFVDDDHFTYEMYSKGPDGKEFMSMKISYTRKK